MSGTICHSYAKVSPNFFTTLESKLRLCAECVHRLAINLLQTLSLCWQTYTHLYTHMQTRAQAAATALRCWSELTNSLMMMLRREKNSKQMPQSAASASSRQLPWFLLSMVRCIRYLVFYFYPWANNVHTKSNFLLNVLIYRLFTKQVNKIRLLNIYEKWNYTADFPQIHLYVINIKKPIAWLEFFVIIKYL